MNAWRIAPPLAEAGQEGGSPLVVALVVGMLVIVGRGRVRREIVTAIDFTLLLQLEEGIVIHCRSLSLCRTDRPTLPIDNSGDNSR